MVRIAAFAGLALAAADWKEFKQKYNKVYNGLEEAKHHKAYHYNMLWAEHKSTDEVTFGENQFADLTQEQYRVAAGLGYKPAEKRWGSYPHLGVHVHNGEELAVTVDWVAQGAVTPVKNQGQCGSCWAFSTTGGMEGAYMVATGTLTSLSEQQLVDCSTDNYGCQGGSMELAFEFASQNAIATEESYPYTAAGGSCNSDFTSAFPANTITGYKSVGQSTQDLQSALQKGPVSVAIQADQRAFQMYSSGILKNNLWHSCGEQLDHGVLAVGYGDGYFKVKNSWGASWGADGYIKISSEGNTCGIHSDASYPVVEASPDDGENGGCATKGYCGIAYGTCCLGFQAKGFPCGCKLTDGGSGLSVGECGDCGAAYALCCSGFAAQNESNACTCDVTDGGATVV